MGNNRFEKLLEPGYIGPVKTKNRMIKTGMWMCAWHEDEIRMNETIKGHYEALARGGIGLLIVETPTVDYPMGARSRNRFRIDDDKYIDAFSELAQLIHKHGCPTFLQLNHDGPWQTFPTSWRKISPGETLGPMTFPGPPIAASAVSLKSDFDSHNETPRELTISEIKEIVHKFATAAVRAEKAGFDGIDINAGSSHLFHCFFSPFWNKRQDAYGCGSLENRARLATEVIQEIKKRLGKDFPVSICINGIEVGQILSINNSECLTPEDSRGIARILQDAGADAIHLRSHWLGRHHSYLPEQLFYPEPPIPLKSFPKEYDRSRRGAGATLLLAAAMKKALSIPVVTVGRLDPVLGEKALREGKADFIAMSRRLLADPELPNKIISGRLEDIAPCVACCTCAETTRHCRVNAALLREYQYEIKQAKKRKKVLVVGGGPAGMEAARVAALRGHEVTLYEKTGKLGGLLPMAALVQGLEIESLPDLVRYLETQVNKLGVKTKLGKEVDTSVIEEIRPDVLILATGGIPTIPGIPGINRRNVKNTPKLHRMLKFYLRFLGPRAIGRLTKFWMPIGKRVVIIGGTIHGCELAEFLAKRGRKVTIVDTGDELGEGMVPFRRAYLFDWFRKKGVAMMSQVKYEEITEKGLTIISKEGERHTIEADNIIPAMPMAPNNKLLKSFEGKVNELHVIGDCREPKLIVDAIADGSRIARAI